MFSICSNSWHEQTPSELAHAVPRQMENLEADALRKQTSSSAGPQSTDMPPEYWDAVLSDPSAGARPSGGVPVQQRRLSEIPRDVLRVTLSRESGFEELWSIMDERRTARRGSSTT